jgi:CRP/FNR family transcriptional regulator
MDPEKRHILRNIYLFSGLSEEDLEAVGRLAVSRFFPKETFIFWEGKEAAGFFILLAGRAKLMKSSPDGKEFILRLVNPGETFGEAAVLAEDLYPATAIALTDCQTLFFPKGPFLSLLSASPRLARNMLATMSRLLYHLTRQLEDLSLKEVSSRLARFILEKCLETHGRIDPNLTFALNITKTHLAAYLGTISETLSRTLARLKAIGAIAEDKGQITIKDPALLQSIAQGAKVQITES